MEIMQIFHSEPTVEFKLCQKAVPNNNSPIYIVYLLKKVALEQKKIEFLSTCLTVSAWPTA
jgi:hypothetical protein